MCIFPRRVLFAQNNTQTTLNNTKQHLPHRLAAHGLSPGVNTGRSVAGLFHVVRRGRYVAARTASGFPFSSTSAFMKLCPHPGTARCSPGAARCSPGAAASALCIGMLWTETRFVDGKRLTHQCTSNRKFYTIGGDDGSVYFVSVEEYDPATDTWMARASVLTDGRIWGSSREATESCTPLAAGIMPLWQRWRKSRSQPRPRRPAP